MLEPVKNSIFLLFIVALMFMSAGCGTEQKPAASGSSNTPASGTEASGEKPAETVELTVSAAASMTDALKDIQKAYETKNPNIKLNFNFGDILL